MRTIIALFFILMLSISCSKKKDDLEVQHVTGDNLTECYQITSEHMTNIDSDGLGNAILTDEGSYLFYSVDENKIINIDKDLNVLWEKTYSNIKSKVINLEQIVKDISGDFLILSTKLNEFSEVTKISTDGGLIWRSKFQDSSRPQYSGLLVDENNDYVLVGSIETDSTWRQPIITKINDQGELVWSNVIPTPNPDILHSISKNSEKQMVLGRNANSESDDIFSFFIDQEGNNSTRNILGEESGWKLESLASSDNTFLALSMIDKSPNNDLSNSDIQLIKFDNDNDIKWTKTYGGNKRELPWNMIESKNGGYYIIGNTTSFGFGGFDIFLIKTDLEGEILWQNVYGTPDSELTGIVMETENADLIIAGVTGTDDFNIFILKLDENGVPK